MKTSIFLNKIEKFIASPLDLNNVVVGLLNTTLKTHKIKKNHLEISTLTHLRFPRQWSLYTTTDSLIWPVSCPLWSVLSYGCSSAQPLTSPQWVLTAFQQRLWCRRQCSSPVNTKWYSQRELGILSKDVKLLTSLPLEPRKAFLPLLETCYRIYLMTEHVN